MRESYTRGFDPVTYLSGSLVEIFCLLFTFVSRQTASRDHREQHVTDLLLMMEILILRCLM